MHIEEDAKPEKAVLTDTERTELNLALKAVYPALSSKKNVRTVVDVIFVDYHTTLANDTLCHTEVEEFLKAMLAKAEQPPFSDEQLAEVFLYMDLNHTAGITK